MQLTLTSQSSTGLVVEEDLFGGNHLYARNSLDASATFDNAVSDLGVHGLRYPGGTMTERWGAEFIADPDSPPSDFDWATTFVGLSDFLAWTEANGQPATIVIPTSQILAGDPGSVDRSVDAEAVAAVKAFVKDVLTDHPGADIDGFEIGNEYYGTVTNMTSTEYGRVADALAIAIQEAIDETLAADADQPAIYAQMGAVWGRDFEVGGTHGDASLSWREKVVLANDDILSELSETAKRAIDGVIEHYYYSETDDALTLGDGSFYDADLNFIEIAWDQQLWREEFARGDYGALEFVVTEWGPWHNNSSQFGLKSAAVLLEMFEGLLRLGVDVAHVWPIELGGPTDLAGMHDGSDGAESDLLTPIGEAFRLMAEHTVGLELLNNGLSATDAAVETVEVNSFGSDDRFVVFIASRSDDVQEISLDVSAYVTSFTSMSGEKIVLNDPDASLTEPWQFATTELFTGDDLGQATTIDVTLGAWQVLMVEYVLDPETGLNWAEASGTQTIYGRRGSDILEGSVGVDLIKGRGGNDILTGLSGNDVIVGNLGADILYGNTGADILKGGRGRDLLSGDQGEDRLVGGFGNDTLNGGADNDVLIGGRGRDRLIAGSGDDWMKGGRGADVFVLTSGSDTIADFRAVDRIDLSASGIGFDDLVLTTSGNDLLVDYGAGEVLLLGWGHATPDQDDFIF